MLALAATQYGLVTRQQLLEFGLSSQGVKHRAARGKLHPIYRGVYALGRPEVTAYGRWMAALLACGPGAVLSHDSAAAYWRLGPREDELDVTICPPRRVRVVGIRIHRSRALPPDQVVIDGGLAVTDVLRTLIDLAPRWGEARLEDAIEAADRRDLCDPERLANALSTCPSIPGTATVQRVLERWTLTLTDTQLERRFLPIARRAGLGDPLTQQWLNGSRVDFFWPELGLVVEADGLRYHRTPVRQTADARRDQRHIAAGLTPLRFSHAQITYRPDEVEDTLRRVAARIRLASGPKLEPEPGVMNQ
ncbi:MAG: hypothetical protein QOI10_48 [Solirubrobacterales bacterium]|nr:hypothetical protein [Solirubrobacterales bacterium]